MTAEGTETCQHLQTASSKLLVGDFGGDGINDILIDKTLRIGEARIRFELLPGGNNGTWTEQGKALFGRSVPGVILVPRILV